MANPDLSRGREQPVENPQMRQVSHTPIEKSVVTRRGAIRLIAGAAGAVMLASTQISSEQEDPIDAKNAAPKAEAPKEATREKTELEKLVEQELAERLTVTRLGQMDEFCVDGRCKDKVVGAPGGSGDIILTGADVLESMNIDVKNPEVMDKIFRAYKGTIRRHTDYHAVHALMHRMQEEPLLAKYAETEARVVAALRDGIDETRAQLRFLEVLGERGKDKKGNDILLYAGCGHEARMGGKPEEYGMSREVFDQYYPALFREGWRKRQAKHAVIDPVEGEHGEKCVVVIKFTWPLEDAGSLVPTFTPSNEKGDKQFFVYHPQVHDHLMEQYAKELAKEFPGLDVEEFMVQARAVAKLHFDLTGNKLAKGKDIVEVTVRGPKDYDVKEIGKVQ